MVVRGTKILSCIAYQMNTNRPRNFAELKSEMITKGGGPVEKFARAKESADITDAF